jgi:hypothetical protein
MSLKTKDWNGEREGKAGMSFKTKELIQLRGNLIENKGTRSNFAQYVEEFAWPSAHPSE